MLYVSWFLFAVNIKSIKSALDLHLMSSRCTVCMDSTNKTIVFIFLLLLLPSSSLLLARGTGGNEVDYGGTAYEHEIKGMCFV